MWKLVHDSVTGTSHDSLGLRCQDAHRVGVFKVLGEPVLVAVCSDGAGSASMAERGSQIVCDELLRLAEEFFASAEAEMIDRQTVEEWLTKVRSIIEDEGTRIGFGLKDYAATVVGAIVRPNVAGFFQIGDGAMVALEDHEYRCIFWPQSGEYANTTTFVTDSNFLQSLQFKIVEHAIEEFACFTDGLERLALRFSDRSAHPPFFAPLFQSLRSSTDFDGLFASLRAFLSSQKVNDRTDDDKTLILAVRAYVGHTVV